MAAHSGSTPWRAPVGVGLASVGLIALQLVLMQELSIAQWYHFAYMVISMAMLGFGAAGTVMALWRRRLQAGYQLFLPALFLACGVTMATARTISGLAGDFDVFLLFAEPGQVALLVFVYLVLSLPFFFGGLAVTLVFYCETDRIGKLYFANMFGSGAGAALTIALLWFLPLPWLPSLLALPVFVAAWLNRPRSRRFSAAFVLAALAPVLVLINSAPIEPSQYKAISASLELPGAEIVHRSYSPYGRVDVVGADAQRFAPSLSLQYEGEPPVLDYMFNNGEYFGALLADDGGDDSHVLDYTTRALPYRLRDPDQVAVLDAGTGPDVSHAVHSAADRVVAVESNRHALSLLKDSHPEWNGGLYRRRDVSVHAGSARNYLASERSEGRDLIVAPVIGSFGGTSGVDALNEKFDLTREAFEQMWQRLSEEGMVAATVWLEFPPRASLRLLATWRALLERHDMTPIVDHLVAVRSWGTITFVLSRQPFSDQALNRAREFADTMGFDPLVMRGLQDGERQRFNRIPQSRFFEQVDTLVDGEPERLHRQYPFDVRPVRDTRPYFAQFMQWQTLPRLEGADARSSLTYMALGFVLAAVTFVQIMAVSVVLIVLPLLRLGWQGSRRRWTLLYFSGTGAGFMFFEIALIQQLVLYLGNAVHATAMTLATLLIASAAGSYASASLELDRRRIRWLGVGLAALVAATGAWLSPVLGATIGASLPARLGLAAALLALPAFVAGMMFPLGLRSLSPGSQSHVAWACGIDSCLSVTATALATLVVLQGGFASVMAIAALAYGLTAIAATRLGTR